MRVAADDWFRVEHWSEDASAHFEAKLARAHRESRPQYLRIQGSTLIDATDDASRRAGAALLERLLDEYSEAWPPESAGAHVDLARYREETGDVASAAAHYRAAVLLQQGTNMQWGAEIELAELIIRHALRDAEDEADELLDGLLADGLFLRSEQFRYAVARMRLARRRGDADEAAAFACGALHLLADNRSISSHHPQVGLILADEVTRAELEEAAAQGDPEVVTEEADRFRGPDGTVRWVWSLTSSLRAQTDPQREDDGLLQDLRAAGFEAYELEEWSQERLPDMAAVKAAAPILLRWLEQTQSLEVKCDIAVALTDRRYRRFATGPLLEEFRRLRSPDLNGEDRPTEAVARKRRLKDGVANALATLARDEHFDEVAELIRDPVHGLYRGYLFWAVPYMKSAAAVDLALEMLKDEDMHLSALRALADLRSERALPTLEAIAARPRPRGRSDADEFERARVDIARGGIEKLQRARAAGKSRP